MTDFPTPRRYLFTMWEGGGTVPPELCVARQLIARGHTVTVIADPTIEAEARDAGCEFMPWVTAPHCKSRDPSDAIIKDWEFSNPLKAFGPYIDAFLAGPADRWIADTLDAIDRAEADVLVADFALPSTLFAAEKVGLPCATILPNIYLIPTPGIPPIGPGLKPARGPLGRARDAAMRSVMTRVFNRALPRLNEVRGEHGLAPLDSTWGTMLRSDRVLVLTSPAFDFTSPAMPSHVRYVGPQLDDPSWAEPWESPWAADDARPLVLAGLSSGYQNQEATLHAIVKALAGLPIRGVVTLGQAIDPEPFSGTENVSVVASAPHNQILPHASLAIIHCGHGTTMKALAAGVPLVCLPMGRDQNDTAARVAYHGAGIRLKPKSPPEKIAAAVKRVLGEPSFAASSRRLAAAIKSGVGCSNVVAELEEVAAIGSKR